MKAIYPPKGRAQEYGALACNLSLFCDHGCKYCFAPVVLRKTREDFHNPENVKPREGILDTLKKEAPKYVGKSIFFCFSCDPGHPSIANTTIEAIEFMNSIDVSAMVLTKSSHANVLFPAMQGHPENRFGMTLTFTSMKDSFEWEPKAALPLTRVELLEEAHKLGIKTWASMEPVIYPRQTLELIHKSHTFVDHFKVGKLNGHPHAKTINWPQFHMDALEILEECGCNYYIKRDLREAN